MARVSYNLENGQTKSIKTEMTGLFAQLNLAITKAKGNGNLKLAKALQNRLDVLYIVDQEILKDVVHLQNENGGEV